MAEDVTKILEQIGYSYFKVEEPIVIEELIIQILLGKEKRFLKAIPFIIYLTTKNPSFSFTLEKLSNTAQKKGVFADVRKILSITAIIFDKIEPENILLPKLKAYVTRKPEYFIFPFNEYLYDFIAQKRLYDAEQQITNAQKINRAKEYDLEYGLNILFKPKQREIVQKVLDNTQLTKVEYDYYFKTIKKRLRAVKLLGDFADTLIQKKVLKRME